MTDTQILNWLDDFLTYDHMEYLFGNAGIASDGGPRDLRATVKELMNHE